MWVIRSPSTHKMSPWVKKVFLDVMPRMLMMRRPPYSPRETYDETYLESAYINDGDFR
jgi:nicotinic acetylcholine receptor